MTNIAPHQYFYLKKNVAQLINAYQSVNDKETITTFQAQIVEKMTQAVSTEFEPLKDLIDFALNTSLTKAKAQDYFESFKKYVTPFEMPTAKQLEKTFKKVKKLKLPTEEMDLQETSYLGWNDPATQRKYLLLREEGKLVGVYGKLAAGTQKGICSICHSTQNVALFLATTKASADGTYTKKGNYICVDSQNCNHHLYDLEHLHQFYQTVKS